MMSVLVFNGCRGSKQQRSGSVKRDDCLPSRRDQQQKQVTLMSVGHRKRRLEDGTKTQTKVLIQSFEHTFHIHQRKELFNWCFCHFQQLRREEQWSRKVNQTWLQSKLHLWSKKNPPLLLNASSLSSRREHRLVPQEWRRLCWCTLKSFFFFFNTKRDLTSALKPLQHCISAWCDRTAAAEASGTTLSCNSSLTEGWWGLGCGGAVWFLMAGKTNYFGHWLCSHALIM